MGSFVREGGRAGYFKYMDADRSGQLEWELLAGQHDLVIFGESCWWTSPDQRQMTKEEVRTLVRQLATAQALCIDLAFADERETVG
jgi:hypothetical protein